MTSIENLRYEIVDGRIVSVGRTRKKCDDYIETQEKTLRNKKPFEGEFIFLFVKRIGRMSGGILNEKVEVLQ